MMLIKTNLSMLDVKHNNFVYESDLINKKKVLKVVKKLQAKKYI